MPIGRLSFDIMKSLLILALLAISIPAFGQSQGVSMRATNGIGYGNTVINNLIGEIGTGNVTNAAGSRVAYLSDTNGLGAPSNLATNNGNNQFSAAQTVNGAFTNTGYSSTATNYSTKLRVGGAAETADAVNVTGTLRTSGAISVGVIASSGTIASGGNITSPADLIAGAAGGILWSGRSLMSSPADGLFNLSDSTGNLPVRVLFATAYNAARLATSTNWPSLSPASKTNGLNYAELSVMAGTNTTEFASIKANRISSTNSTGNTVVLTNGNVASVSLNVGSANSVTVNGIRHGISGAMVLGTVTVNDAGCTANTRYFFSAHTLGTISIPGGYYASTRNSGTSFVIQSSQATETSTIDWMAIEP